MIKKTAILMVLFSVIGITIFSGCIQSSSTVGIDKITGNTSDIAISQFESTQELKKFLSVQEIREFLKASAYNSNYNRFGWYDLRGSGDFGMVDSSGAAPKIVPAAVSEGVPVPAPAYAGSQGTSDYSKTNIQVEGVDEADFVKNDGKYIYVLAQNKLVIVDAYPAVDAGTLSTITINGRPKEMFVNDDRLIVFTEENDEVYIYPEYGYRPMPRYTAKTSAFIYDITDRKKPEQVANYSINGNYFRSRMIGDYVYLIVKDSAYYRDDVIDVPVIKQGSVKIMSPDVYYFDNPEQNYVFHIIASINIKSDKDIDAKSFMMGYSDNVYVSGNNIYITYRKNLPVRYYEVQREERFYKVIMPQLPKDAQDRINAIRDSNLSSYEKWDKISSILEETYNSMSEKQKQDYIKNVEKAVEEYEIKIAQELEKTVIQKIRIDKGNIEYETKGEVPGSLLNQFSMDEFNDYFRVATTTQFWTRGSSGQYNNVYVMDKDLSIVGKLEEIAQDERIYSTRFIGNRLYMVTFKQIDPLFVIDLSDPKDPKVLGELKIPGFSDYLHPYDENHIIGVGKETGGNEWGGVSIKGVKLSLFDVSDVEKPKQIDTYEIGSAGTDSEALRDHRAFLFDKEKDLLVIPIREIRETERLDRVYGYMPRVWQGAYVFGITPEDGFKLRGKISHLDGYEEEMYYWDSPGAVRRSLYMDDVLYTVSARKILMNSLTNTTEINSIDLPFERNQYYEYGWR
ncbi:secreted protein with C-terminal beta-propeller domain [Candidatus Methanoperedens nitroreducens]|uniref:Secreted protein with C-terminal beta-propeller domain n=1 Tax=Candidatus Methanoperedens nitratireducens TaxID=1392998 RepID=A0A062UVE9_9EURY|nr:beta-propeller domain-containing protein [Candidatus Methanoperedens nitroreducens]KCZ70991.1 secreted protein with C-terminal beta-propeller domain [Candidatus Methanoperedens nitroreducens]MDJ1421639.1 beta-propeller domain-containing protein [Candidatus Methanoperedens sp.]